MVLWKFLGSLKTRNRQKIRQQEFLLITGYSEDTPENSMNRNDLFDPQNYLFSGAVSRTIPAYHPSLTIYKF
jgi:hypothetical protein